MNRSPLSHLLSFPSYLADFPISNYQENYDPYAAQIFAILFTVLAIFITCYVGWTIYQRAIRFRLTAYRLKLIAAHTEFLRAFTQKLNISNPAKILLKRREFDLFSQKVSESYSSGTAIDDLRKDAHFIYEARRQLRFRHDFKAPLIRSSRALPKAQELTLLFFDENKKKFLIFNAKILRRQELFLEVSGPSIEMGLQLLSQPRPLLEIWFRKASDPLIEYRYEARCMFSIPIPDNVLFLEHSRKLTHIELIPDIKLPGTILYSATEEAEEVEEYSVLLKELSHLQAVLKLVAPIEPALAIPVLAKEGFLLITFKLKETEITCKGIIANSKDKGEGIEYSVNFREQSLANLQTLIAFMRDPKKYLP